MLMSGLDFSKAVRATKQPHYMMSPKQRKLMGLRAVSIDTYQQNGSPMRSQSNGSPISGGMVPGFNLAELKLNKNQASTPARGGDGNPFRYMSPSPSSSFHTSATSASSSPPNMLHGSYVSHRGSKFGRTSPNSPSSFDGSFLNTSGGSPMFRHRKSYTNSPLRPEDYMTDKGTLKTYLENYDKENSKLNAYEKNNYNNMNWNKSMNAHDLSSELSENIYQLSTLSPKSPTRTKENKDDSARQAVEEYWKQHDVKNDGLSRSVASLRQYLSVTVLRRFAIEIDRINKKLDEIGCTDTKVGKTQLSSLKLIQLKYLQQVPSLTWMLFYLELSNNQEYLVKRISTLASGYMSAFKWNKEAKPKLRESEEELPNDCDIVMHALCVYINLHFPLHPRYPDGKSFSSCYYRDASKESKKFDSKLYIQRSKQNPPHYQVVNDGKLYDPSGGRHNFFHAVILFLHFVKREHNSLLGPVSLGTKGLNILHVLDM